MQVTGDHFWMHNWAQNTAQQKANAGANPLLKRALNAIGQQDNSKTPDAISTEMEAKIRQINEEAKIDPTEKTLSKAMEELAFVDQEMYGALFDARQELRDLTDKHEAFTNILNGTVDYDEAIKAWYIDFEDRDRFSFTDFDTYLVENGYQGDATQPVDILNAEWITAENSMGITVTMFAGQALVKGEDGTMDRVIFEDQVPLYEQWQKDKKAHEVATLQQYAAEKLPQIQKSIEEFPQRLGQIAATYALKKAAIIEKLPEGALTHKYTENMKSISDIAEKIKTIAPGDGKELLDLLNQMMKKQGENTVSLGGVANGGFVRPQNGRVEIDLHV